VCTCAQVNEKAITHADNVYNIPNITIKATACRTNLASNTAFRGFGGPQGMMVMEQIMSRVANSLKLPLEALQELNMYSEGDRTPYDMPLSNCTIRKCLEEVKNASSFASRKAEVKKFNWYD
jgi:xanthine dehydrogenase/oxidase